MSFAFTLLLILWRAWGVMRPREMLCCLLYCVSSSFTLLLSDPTLVAIGFEFMALAAMFLVAQGCSKGVDKAFLHYAAAHFIAGALLLVGACRFAQVGQFFGLYKASYMIGLLINAASFPMSSWVSHAYPMSSRFGIMALSTFTTKAAAYTLLRIFPGDPMLVYAGSATAVYGTIFALLARDVRKMMSYNVIGQMGLILISVGLGGISPGVTVAQMALSVLYQALLFMVADVVVVNSSKGTNGPGGATYPLLVGVLCCLVAVFNMGAFPGSAGFVVKSLILHGAWADGLIGAISKQVFLVCSVSLFAGVGLRLVWSSVAQFHASRSVSSGMSGYLSGIPMLLLALVLLILGVFHRQMLSFTGEQFIYTLKDVASQTAILAIAALCFIVSLRNKLLGRYEFAVDVDWVYRCLLPSMTSKFCNFVIHLYGVFSNFSRVCSSGSGGEGGCAWAIALRHKAEASDSALLLCMLVVGIVLVLTYV
ncbi:proton-conducting transporter transmembrane domain-containing protein [Anaplasma capra]|nr:proton-conducting transporter membrane subunit [Anaplasma capra]